MPKLIEGVS
jgi:hypothetical protein